MNKCYICKKNIGTNNFLKTEIVCKECDLIDFWSYMPELARRKIITKEEYNNWHESIEDTTINLYKKYRI